MSELAHDREGDGPPLLLIHGTNSSRRVWDGIRPALVAQRDVIAVDLPGFGESPPGALEPAGFAAALGALLDELGVRRPAVVGHSVGGWTALELAKRSSAGAVLALTPAGLWRRRSPRRTDAFLMLSWQLGRLAGPLAEPLLRTPAGRRAALRGLSADPAGVPAEVAIATARTARGSRHFRAHFAATRSRRFTGGGAIDPGVPVRVVWGDRDGVALAGKSDAADELPAHAQVERWTRCGHMVMWDRPAETVEAILALPAGGG